ncbi:MAG: amino acid permease [Gammaproteobacteria bacterium]|nr:amino acid permease [Gammaproteobacteria bacterium]
MTTTTDTGRKKGQLVRAIGFLGVAILALNSVIGAGIFALPATVTARAGALSPWLFLVVGLLVITIVLTFAELASYFRDSGGPVLYTTTAFGPLVGFGTGWILYISRVSAFAANSNAFANYLGSVWPLVSEGAGRTIVIIALSSALTYANYTGVKDGVRTLAVFTFMKLTPIAMLIIFGLQYVSGDTFIPSAFPVIEDLGGTVLLLIYAFVGFESTTIVSGESKNPRRSLPVAMVTTLIGIGVLYFLIVLVYVSVLPNAGASDATLITVGGILFGPIGVIALTLAAVFSIGGNLAAIMLAVPRLTFAMAEQHLLPKWFGVVNQKHATPGNSIIFLGGLGIVLALTGSFVQLAIASSLTRLISYILCISALPTIRRKADEETRAGAYRLIGGYTIPVIALVVCVWIAAQSKPAAWIFTAQLLAIGLVFYGIARISRKRRGA